MISRILNIAKIAQISQNTKHYNVSLPILLQVLEKTRNGYLLKLGQNTIEAKSANTLQLGAKYWANVREGSVGEILISTLIKQPKIVDYIKDTRVKWSFDEVNEMFKDSQFIQHFKERLIEQLSTTQSKDDFLFLSNSLFALSKHIINLVISNNKKDILLQIKKPHNNKVEFCAIFANLGVINGIIFDLSILHLITQYKSVKTILENNINNLQNYQQFETIKILVNEGSATLFDLYDENLLDVEV